MKNGRRKEEFGINSERGITKEIKRWMKRYFERAALYLTQYVWLLNEHCNEEERLLVR